MNLPITLHSGLRAELDGLAYLRESLKLSARALLYRRQTGRWLQLLNSHPLFREMLPACPRLVNKIYRSYFSTRLRCDDRLAVLQAHYDMVIGQGLAPLVAQAAAGPVELCRLQARCAEAGYRIELRAGAVLCREGELVLQLMHGAELLYSIAFSFLRHDAGIAIGIGCLQGAPGGGGLDRIRSATRELHGMRPKNLLVRLVRQFGHDLGCDQLVLVGNHNRVVTTSMRQGKVHADYDGLWQELDAWRRPDGNFGLNCERPGRTADGGDRVEEAFGSAQAPRDAGRGQRCDPRPHGALATLAAAPAAGPFGQRRPVRPDRPLAQPRLTGCEPGRCGRILPHGTHLRKCSV